MSNPEIKSAPQNPSTTAEVARVLTRSVEARKPELIKVLKETAGLTTRAFLESLRSMATPEGRSELQKRYGERLDEMGELCGIDTNDLQAYKNLIMEGDISGLRGAIRVAIKGLNPKAAVQMYRKDWDKFAQNNPELAEEITHLAKNIAVDVAQGSVQILISKIPGLNSSIAKEALGKLAEKLLINHLEALRESKPDNEALTSEEIQSAQETVTEALSEEIQALPQEEELDLPLAA